MELDTFHKLKRKGKREEKEVVLDVVRIPGEEEIVLDVVCTYTW